MYYLIIVSMSALLYNRLGGQLVTIPSTYKLSWGFSTPRCTQDYSQSSQVHLLEVAQAILISLEHCMKAL